MAYYKRVVYRADYAQAKAELEANEGEEYENTVDYDGDVWIVVEYLLDKLTAELDKRTRQRDDAMERINILLAEVGMPVDATPKAGAQDD